MKLHWSPIHIGINFKRVLLKYKAICGLVRSYITDLTSTICMEQVILCDPPKKVTETIHYVSLMQKLVIIYSFSMAAPKFWNSPPTEIK